MSLSRHVILLEGLARNYVEALGSKFNMDPALFANQKRPNSWELSQFNIERTANLPSLNNPRQSFMIRYPEIRYFPLINGRTQLDQSYIKDIDGHRRVNISRRTREINKYKDSTSGQFDNIGVVNRAASYWSRKYDGGNWVAVLLIDPPAGRLVRTTPPGGAIDGLELRHVLLHGGYLDFVPYPETLDGSQEFIKTAAAGPSRVSILEDICFYFEYHARELKSSWDDPSIATVFLKKIAASNWVQLTDYFNASAHNLEHHFSRNESFDIFTIQTIERWWGDLHSWHRRCVQHYEEVNAILVSLRIPPDWTMKNEHEYNAMGSHEDFAWVYNKLLWTKSRFELLMESATGLNAIAGNKEAAEQNERYSRKTREESKHSFEEARKASILTFLATVFLPLSVTAGIFSMSSEWAPGGQNFKYYWVISVPLVFLLGGAYYLFERVPWMARRVDDNELGYGLNDLEMG